MLHARHNRARHGGAQPRRRAASVLSTEGDIHGADATQQNALALKAANSGVYSARVRIKGPFTPSVVYQSAGIVLAVDANNYLKLVLGQGDAGPRLEFAIETSGAFASAAPDVPFTLTSVDSGTEAIDLWLVRQSNATVKALYRTVTNLGGTPSLGAIIAVGATASAPAWAVSSPQLYAGPITTDFGPGPSFTTVFDEFELGPAVTEGGGGIPPPPAGLTAVASTSSIALAWNASGGATGYNVFRSTNSPVSTAGTPLNGTTPLSATTYTDTTATPGVLFFYVVTAVNSFGSSPASAPASAQVPSRRLLPGQSPGGTVLNFSSSVSGTYAGTGFGCFMPGTVVPDGTGLTLAPFGSQLTVASTDGDIHGAATNQHNALALKVDNSGGYSARVRIKGPFTPAVAYQSAGVFLALDANNYAKFVLGQGDAGARLEFAVETGGAFAAAVPDVPFDLATVDASSEAIDLWLVRKANGTLEALYRAVSNLTGIPVSRPICLRGQHCARPRAGMCRARSFTQGS